MIFLVNKNKQQKFIKNDKNQKIALTQQIYKYHLIILGVKKISNSFFTLEDNLFLKTFPKKGILDKTGTEETREESVST